MRLVNCLCFNVLCNHDELSGSQIVCELTYYYVHNNAAIHATWFEIIVVIMSGIFFSCALISMSYWKHVQSLFSA